MTEEEPSNEEKKNVGWRRTWISERTVRVHVVPIMADPVRIYRCWRGTLFWKIPRIYLGQIYPCTGYCAKLIAAQATSLYFSLILWGFRAIWFLSKNFKKIEKSRKWKGIKTSTNPKLPRAFYRDLRWNLCLWYLVSKRFFICVFMYFIMDFKILFLFMHNAQNTRKWVSTERR